MSVIVQTQQHRSRRAENQSDKMRHGKRDSLESFREFRKAGRDLSAERRQSECADPREEHGESAKERRGFGMQFVLFALRNVHNIPLPRQPFAERGAENCQKKCRNENNQINSYPIHRNTPLYLKNR